MGAWEATLTLSLGFVFLYLFKKWFDFQKLPPGPWGVPILGYLPFLLLGNTFKIFEGLKKRYGSLFSLKIGKFNVVILDDYKLIAEAFSKEVFSGRPAFDIVMFRNHGKKRGIVWGDGSLWAEHRRYAIRNLRVFGFGKHNTMDSLLNTEIQDIVHHFDKHIGKPFNLRTKLNASVLNSLWYLCTGSRFESDDPEFQFCIHNLTENMGKMHLTGVPFFFPWVLYQDYLMKGIWKIFQETRDRVQGLIRSYIEEHKKTFDPSLTRDLLDALISKSKTSSDPSNTFHGPEGELNILLDLTDLFIAGTETTSTTLQWGILYLMAFPEVQEKLQEEIDSVLGTRLPCLDDKRNMLYTAATLNEIHRFCSLAPFAIYHSTMESTQLHGYTLPKDTVVMANLRGVHHDPAYWKDPHVFRPERFIDPILKKIIKHERFIPFSCGKRQCLGMELANDTLFIFFTTLFQRYNFSKVPSIGDLDLEFRSPSFVIGPKPFDVIMTLRHG